MSRTGDSYLQGRTIATKF